MEDVLTARANNVAANIRKIREHRYYTQDYLAAKLKISQNAYSKIELGYSKLTIHRLFQIAVILNVAVVHLLAIDQNDFDKIIAHDKKEKQN